MAGVLRNPARAANAEGDSHKEVEDVAPEASKGAETRQHESRVPDQRVQGIQGHSLVVACSGWKGNEGVSPLCTSNL